MMKNQHIWESIIDNRVAMFYKPYSQMLNFSTFTLVAHRNMLSVYNMTTNDDNAGFVDTIAFP